MAKKQSNTGLLISAALVAGFLLFRRKPAVEGIGATKYQSVDQVVKNAWNNRQTGREKIVNDTLHYGVGPHPYAYKRELNEAGVEYTDKGSAMGYITSKRELQKFVEWLELNDGYLAVSY